MLNYVQRPGERGWFERPEGMSPVLHRLLTQRGVDSVEAAEEFLHPGIQYLHDPFLLHDMREAVEQLQQALQAGEPICVYGDYDADGVCASAILSEYLKGQGAQVEVYLPSRHDEGYGLNEAAVREIAERAKLLVTVDCGIGSIELIELAKSLGMRCVVTDHHRPGERIPDCPVVNPLLGDYPFRWLCGAGVAFKLVSALAGLDAAMEWIDLAAIATVADMVSLTGENRSIVRLGLDRINRAPRLGLAALMRRAQVEPGELTSYKIGFRIAPRLNAGGRLGTARRSFDLLTQKEEFLAEALADELDQENTRRQSIEREISERVIAQVEQLDFSAHRILMVRGEDWNPGVVGLVAGDLRKRYNYPAIVLNEVDGMLSGSCRSIDGVDIYQVLCAGAELMDHFGGHSQAAGLTLPAENFDALWERLDAYLAENVPPSAYLPREDYDMDVALDEVTEELVEACEALEPTGQGNPAPVFRTRVQLINAFTMGSDKHLKLICAGCGVQRTAVYFWHGELLKQLGESAELLFTPNLNSFRGRTELQLKVSSLRDVDVGARLDAARKREGGLQRRFLTELLYNRRQSCDATAPVMELSELRARLAASPQGTFVLCGGMEPARRLLAELGPLPVDLCIGAVPEDARGFNAIVVLPERLGEYPKSLRTLVLAGLPAPDEAPPGVEVRSLRMESGLEGELPDVDRMRQVYIAARNLCGRPIQISNLEALEARLSEESGLSPTCCHASLLALVDLDLVQLQQKPLRMLVPRRGKTDPESSAIWRAIESLGRIIEESRGE